MIILTIITFFGFLYLLFNYFVIKKAIQNIHAMLKDSMEQMAHKNNTATKVQKLDEYNKELLNNLRKGNK